MLFTSLLSILAPHECLGCDREGTLLCEDCHRGLTPSVRICYACHKFDATSRTCPACRRTSALYAVYAAVRYEKLAKDLVWKLKFGRARAAAYEMASMMASSRTFDNKVIVTHAPTATDRVRQRGYDQAALLAKALAKKQGLTYRPLLARQGKLKQVGASRNVRAKQLQTAFRPIKIGSIKGAHIIIVDDVVTTGATLRAAANALKGAGAKHVEAIVFAQA